MANNKKSPEAPVAVLSMEALANKTLTLTTAAGLFGEDGKMVLDNQAANILNFTLLGMPDALSVENDKLYRRLRMLYTGFGWTPEEELNRISIRNLLREYQK